MLNNAINLLGLGWSIFPCHHITDNGQCSCGNENCKSKGKHPTIPNGVNGASNDIEVIKQWWTVAPNANIGVATGKVSGIFVVDIDVANGKIGETSLSELENIYGKLLDTLTVQTGSGGYHYYFKYPQGVEIPSNQNTLGTHIDVRADGGYVLSALSNHVQGIYEVLDVDNIADAEIADAPAWMIDLICKQTKVFTGEIIGGSSTEWETMSDIERMEFGRALTFIDNDVREVWVRVGFAIHATDSTQMGFDKWCDWSKSSYKFDIADQARVWASFNNAKPVKRFKESIYFEARKYHYKSLVEMEHAQEIKEKGDSIVDEINNPIIHDPQSYQAPKLAYDEFPVPLANKIAGYINAQSDCYSKTATMQAVISLLALITSRRYCTEHRDSLQLYVGICSSPQGSLGELFYTTMGVRSVLQQCKLRRMVRASRMASSQALYKTIHNCPATLYTCEDYAQMIKLSSRQTTGGMDAVLGVITRLFKENEYIQLDSAEEAGLKLSDFGDEKQPVIYRPSLSMLALLHYNQLPIFSKSSEMGRGSSNQFLMAICDKDEIQYKEEEPRALDQSILYDLTKIRGVGLSEKDLDFKDIISEMAGIESELIPVKFEQNLAPYDKRISAACGERNKNYLGNARKIMRRLMAIFGAVNDYKNPVATKYIMDWCCDYVVYHLTRLIDVLDVVASDDGKMDVRQKVIEVIMNRGAEGITHSDIPKYCRPFAALSKEKRDELLHRLEEDGEAKTVKIKLSSGQSPSRVVYSKFIEKAL